MKARRMAPLKELALTYGLDEPAQARLSAALQRLGIEERQVSPDELGQTVGALAGLPGFDGKAVGKAESAGTPGPREAGELPGGGMLGLWGLSRQRIDLLLRTLTQEGIRIPLKAVVTPTSQHWPFRQWMEELLREHAALHKSAAPPDDGR